MLRQIYCYIAKSSRQYHIVYSKAFPQPSLFDILTRSTYPTCSSGNGTFNFLWWREFDDFAIFLTQVKGSFGSKDTVAAGQSAHSVERTRLLQSPSTLLHFPPALPMSKAIFYWVSTNGSKLTQRAPTLVESGLRHQSKLAPTMWRIRAWKWGLDYY